MAKIRKRTVRWEPSADAKKYRLYWSAQGTVAYDSDFAEIENKNQVILPDEVPSFPKIAGNIELGMTAVNVAGNESDITIARVYVDFTEPRRQRPLPWRIKVWELCSETLVFKLLPNATVKHCLSRSFRELLSLFWQSQTPQFWLHLLGLASLMGLDRVSQFCASKNGDVQSEVVIDKGLTL